MARRDRRARAGSTSTTSTSRSPIGVIALALILFEGGLTAGWSEIRPVLRPAVGLALVGHDHHGGRDGPDGLVAVRVLARSRACCSARSSPRPTAPRSSRCCADRGCGGGSSARWRARRASTTRSPCCSCSASSSGIKHPGYGIADMLLLFVQQLGIGLVAGVAVGWLAREGVRAGAALQPGPLPGRLAGGGGARLRRRRRRCTARASSPSTSAGSRSARRACPRGGPSPRSTRASRGSRSSACSSRSACSSSPATSTRWPGAGRCSRSSSSSWRGRSPTAVSTLGRGFDLREKALLGWAGLRGAVPVVLATFPVIEGVDPDDEFFNIVFFAVVLSTLLQGTTIEPVARWLGVTTGRAAADAVGDRGRHRARARRRRGRARGPARRRRGGRAAARPRAAARRARLADRARRRGAAAARLDAARGRRPPARAACAARSSDELPELLERWRRGPGRTGPSGRRGPTRAASRSTPTRPWVDADGDPSHPRAIGGNRVVEHLRTRRDVPGALVDPRGRPLRGLRARSS